MAKYKKGDIVKVVHEDSQYYGEILIVNGNNSSPYCLDANGKFRTSFHENYLELATGYDAIVKGTVLSTQGNTINKEWTVLGIVGDAYIIKHHDGKGEIFTREQLKNIFVPPDIDQSKGTPVYDKDQNLIGYMTDGKVITN